MPISFIELATVQQDMSTVSHSYEDLGATLKDKRSELESMLAHMQDVQEESSAMKQWLEKMDTHASKWEAALLDTEAVKEQVEQHKVTSVSFSLGNYKLKIISFKQTFMFRLLETGSV